MAKDCSFDIVSEFDKQELVNAVDQVKRELSTRFDLKDSNSDVILDTDKTITITTNDDMKLRNIIDILQSKMIKRNLSIKILDPQAVENALGGNVRQVFNLKKGLTQELSKKIVADIKNTKLKVQASIQGEQVRVSGKDKDDLQAVIKMLRDNADNYNDPDTVGNTTTNSWTGLIPMSSVGKINEESSRLTLYEKGSLTATKGGYRLLASQVNNYTDQVGGDTGEYIEGDGYVAFDLFIKNLSGEEYYVDNEPKNEEAIYLTTNSAVTVSENGGVDGTGIENSVRVAFAQVGRVIADTEDPETITGITCADDDKDSGTGVTGICRSAQIWEPNDDVHTDNAINWYNTSCLSRKALGTDVNDSASYDPQTVPGTSTCEPLDNATAYPTYAISNELTVGSNVNVYDGAAYNTYAGSTTDYDTYAKAEDKSTYKLVEYPYFTDTDKEVAGADRPTFMTLAPNSITKVRVYVYIEGQDIDNYDYASLGKLISINFGFTKERYEEGDVDYTGPDTDITNRVVDYEATGEVTQIQVDGEDTTAITYNKTLKQFIVSTDVKGDFTFLDDGDPKTATFQENDEGNADDTWVIS